MPETSLVVKATDLLTAPVKSMSKTVSAFQKDVEDLRFKMYELSKTRAYAKIDLKQAKEELREAEKQFKETGSSADGLNVLFKEMQVDELSRQVRTLNKELNETDKRLSEAENKADGIGKSSGFFNFFKNFGTKAMYSQLGQLIATSGSQLALTTLGSAAGEDSANFWGSVLNGVASGASVGVLGGTPISVAIGAGVGLVTGITDGLTKNYEKKDDFFKDYYKGLYEERQQAAESGLTAGSTTAGSREQSYKAFEKRLGGEAQANAYLSEVKHMAARTNYDYDEILDYSKLLLNSYAPEETFGLLTTLSDATAGLDLSSSDVEMFIKGFSRMRTTGKTTQEYLNYFSERGVDVYEALARGTGASGGEAVG